MALPDTIASELRRYREPGSANARGEPANPPVCASAASLIERQAKRIKELEKEISDGAAKRQHLDVMDDDERLDVFETIRALYCMFCGKDHPKGGMCQCWDDERLQKFKCVKCGGKVEVSDD